MEPFQSLATSGFASCRRRKRRGFQNSELFRVSKAVHLHLPRLHDRHVDRLHRDLSSPFPHLPHSRYSHDFGHVSAVSPRSHRSRNALRIALFGSNASLLDLPSRVFFSLFSTSRSTKPRRFPTLPSFSTLSASITATHWICADFWNSADR